jgi:hypothetical protein
VTDQPETQPLQPVAATPDYSVGASTENTIGPGDRPEIAVGAAFAGGLVLAMLLKRLAR